MTSRAGWCSTSWTWCPRKSVKPEPVAEIVVQTKRGLAKPIGSLTQMATIRLGKRTENRTPLIKDFVPLAKLEDVVFGGWDVFPDDAFEVAKHAGFDPATDLVCNAWYPGYRREVSAPPRFVMHQEGATLDLPKTDSPFELPTWPEVLPDIKMLNEMAKTDIRAVHKLIDPPLLLHDDGILGGGAMTVNMRPGGLNVGGVNRNGQQMIQPFSTGARVDIADTKMDQRRAAIDDAFLVTLFQILVETPRMTATEALIRAMEYAATFNLTVILHAQDHDLAAGGIAHEGPTASFLGLAGIPESAETVALARALAYEPSVLLLDEPLGALDLGAEPVEVALGAVVGSGVLTGRRTTRTLHDLGHLDRKSVV